MDSVMRILPLFLFLTHLEPYSYLHIKIWFWFRGEICICKNLHWVSQTLQSHWNRKVKLSGVIDSTLAVSMTALSLTPRCKCLVVSLTPRYLWLRWAWLQDVNAFAVSLTPRYQWLLWAWLQGVKDNVE